MTALVHDIKTDDAEIQTQQDAQRNGNEGSWRKENKDRIQTGGQQYLDEIKKVIEKLHECIFVEWVMARPQIQEEAVTMLAAELQERVKPDGLAIVMEADHFCMHWRGVKDSESKMINSVMRGAFLKDANLRREFLSLIGQRH